VDAQSLEIRPHDAGEFGVFIKIGARVMPVVVDAPFIVEPREGIGKSTVIVAKVHLTSERVLAEVGSAPYHARLPPDSAQGGHEDSHQDGNDGDDDEKLDERETAFPLHRVSPSSTTAGVISARLGYLGYRIAVRCSTFSFILPVQIPWVSKRLKSAPEGSLRLSSPI
jgi:hypothetical protein